MIQDLNNSFIIVMVVLAVVVLGAIAFCLFVDEGVLVRDGAIYRAHTNQMVVALTFDDGPSPEWTPRLLDELKNMNVKATFFVIGKHVKKNPELARRIVREGHEIENHTYGHPILINRSTRKLKREIRQCEAVVRAVTGTTTRYVRPPRAWLIKRQKTAINEMGYGVVLWSLNSKDWVTFDDKYMTKHILRNVQPGDIILFHDGGGIFGTEGGNREETIRAIARLVPKLRARGYRFVTVAELLSDSLSTAHENGN